MSKNFLSICMLSLALGMTSCSDFLKESSQDLLRPVSATHFKELLQGDGYFKDYYAGGWFVDLMTDDITVMNFAPLATSDNAIYRSGKLAYQWANDYETEESDFEDVLFKHLYRNVLIANVCINGLENVSKEDKDWDVAMGQAYFQRAYAYFNLANLYAPAYHESNDQSLCVPLLLEDSPSLERKKRATRKQIWDLIQSDIVKSMEFLEKDRTSRSIYEINYKASLLLASRIFLYVGDFQKVKEYGNKLMDIKPELKDITNLAAGHTAKGIPNAATFFASNSNPEVLFAFSKMSSDSRLGGYLYYTRVSAGMSIFSYSVSHGEPGALMEQYQTNDRRKDTWFAIPETVSDPTSEILNILASKTYSPYKVLATAGNFSSQHMRIGELYLNLAEAYARAAQPETDKAITLLNALRSKRIKNYVPLVAADFSSDDALFKFIIEERRRELCFEELHRWWDLRRSGQPAIAHKLDDDTYVLEEKDPGYVLSFPKAEMDFNFNLEPNNRPVRNPK